MLADFSWRVSKSIATKKELKNFVNNNNQKNFQKAFVYVLIIKLNKKKNVDSRKFVYSTKLSSIRPEYNNKITNPFFEVLYIIKLLSNCLIVSHEKHAFLTNFRI